LSESLFRGRSLVHSIIGVGINVNHAEDDFPPTIRPLSTSLFLMTGRGVDKELLLGHLCRALGSWYNTLNLGETGSLIRMYEERMVFSRGDRLVVGTSEGLVAGMYRGLEPDGKMIVEIPDGLRVFSFEEIQSLEGN
jgi:BirA family biotin operon repressor/biotin-[acetyl-CoA-carboxylase] ligase